MRALLFFLLVIVASGTCTGQNADELFNQAEGEFASGKYKEASVLYTKVIAADAENINAYLRRGFCLSVQKEYERAISDYSRVIEKHSNHPFAYISRGSAYNKTENFTSAIADFDKALNIEPKNQEAYNNRGWAKHGMGLYKEACADWKASKKLGNEEAKIILKNNNCK